MVCDPLGVKVAPFEPTDDPPFTAVCQPLNVKFARVGSGKTVDEPF